MKIPLVLAIGILVLGGLKINAYAQVACVVEGPTVLHANITKQWGGHTFCYLLFFLSGKS